MAQQALIAVTAVLFREIGDVLLRSWLSNVCCLPCTISLGAYAIPWEGSIYLTFEDLIIIVVIRGWARTILDKLT